MSMPEPDPRWPQPDVVWLDRLVDGELSPAERRELVARLEAEPEGWRRLALAFLEAQAWREELRGLDEAPLVAAPPSRSAPAEPSRVPDAGGRWGALGQHGPAASSWLALAASLLMAFGLGSWSAGGRNPWAPAAGGSGNFVAQRGSNSAGAPRGIAPGAAADLAGIGLGPGESGSPAVVDLVWADGAASAGRPVHLPVVSPDESWEAWLTQPEVQASGPADRILSRLGHRVNRIRQLVPVTLEDGHVAEVPVERVQIRYVADDYQ